MRRLLALFALAVAGPALAKGPARPFTVAETGRTYATIQQAVDAVRDGEATILIGPGVFRQCAVQDGGRITYRAVTPGTVIFEREVCEDKAALVLRGRGSIVDGLIFRGYRVSDGNGAGIRTEIGDLTVRNAIFLDSQEGIIGGHPSAQKITIDRTTFSGLGQCDESVNCAHSIYLINRGSVTVTRSRFERGTGGHYAKVRTPNITITSSRFDDSAGRNTNYAIDLAEGGTGLIAGNSFVQGPSKENDGAVIAVAPEGTTYPTAGLRIENNLASLSPGARSTPFFVRDWSGGALKIGANRLGKGVRPFERVR
jgi:hypothetical protein